MLKTILPLLFLTTSIQAADIFCCSDTYKITADGNVVEFSGKEPGKLAEKNTIFSKMENSVTLAGARGETIAFQIVIPGPANGVKVSLENLKSKDGNEISKSQNESILIGFIRMEKEQKAKGKTKPSGEKEGFFPDICIPLSKVGGSFDIPYSVKGLTPVPNQKVGLVLQEIKIPSSAKGGEYEGTLLIEGNRPATLKVKLTVLDFEIPPNPTYAFDVNSYGSPLSKVTKDHRNPYQPIPPKLLQLEHDCFKLFNLHRMYVNILPVQPQRGLPYYGPALHGEGKEIKCDWTHFDQRFGPVLSGELFDNKQPVPYFMLPINLHWPHGYSHDEKLEDKRIDFTKNPDDFTKSTTPQYQDELKAVAQQFIDHFAEKGWKRTKFQVFVNQSDEPHAKSPWRLDEPYNKQGYAVLQWFAKFTNQFMRDNSKGVPIFYRIDIGHWNCRDPKVQCPNPKQWEPDNGEAMLEADTDHWYVNTIHGIGNRHRVPLLNAKGPHKEFWMYGGRELTTGSATKHRSLFWHVIDMSMKGYCAVTDVTGKVNQPGGDTLCYDGSELGLESSLPSLRMKIWARSNYDSEYITLAKAKNEKGVKSLMNEMIAYKTDPKFKYPQVELPDPNNNPEDWEVARLELAGIITGKDFSRGLKRTGRLDSPSTENVDQIENY